MKSPLPLLSKLHVIMHVQTIRTAAAMKLADPFLKPINLLEFAFQITAHYPSPWTI